MTSINPTNYREFPAIANSDLTWLKKQFMPEDRVIDLTRAYANGTLIDAMITEPHRVDYFKLKVEGESYQYSGDEFEAAKEMKKAFMRDLFCQQMLKLCSFQRISYKPEFKIAHDGFEFSVAAKAKWDLFCETMDMGGDIKSTTATTQKQAEEACRYFDYPRSRAWYMDLEGRSNDMLIFISKVNYKIFKIPVKRDSELYKDGKAQYQEWAFKYASLFGELKTNAA